MPFRLFGISLSILCGGFFAFSYSGASSKNVYAVRNATVLTMDQDRVLRNQTILVSDDKISALGAVGDVQIPEGATVIEARGKFVMPGLVDMHSHLNIIDDDLLLNLANGITTVRVLYGNPNILEMKKRVLAKQILGAAILTSGPILDGERPVHPGSVALTSPEQAVEEVRREAREGYDFVKVYNGLSREVYDAVVRTAREVNLPVMGHVPDQVGIEAVWASGQVTIEHWQGLPEFLRQGSGKVDLGRIPEYVEKTFASGIWNCPTMVVIERGFGSSAAQMEMSLTEPEMKYVHPALKAMWQGHLDSVKKLKDWPTASSKMLTDLGPELTKRLYDRGAKLLLGTDNPNPFVIPGFSIHRELANFQNAGIPTYEVLKIATLRAAEALGRADSMGSIAVGKEASFLVLDRDPRADVKVLKENLGGVMMQGRWNTSAELRTKIDEIAKKYSEMKTPVVGHVGGHFH